MSNTPYSAAYSIHYKPYTTYHKLRAARHRPSTISCTLYAVPCAPPSYDMTPKVTMAVSSFSGVLSSTPDLVRTHILRVVTDRV